MAIYKCTKCKGIHEKGYKCNVKSTHKKEQDKLIQSTRWRQLRLYILDRDNYICQRCLYKYNIVNSNDLTVHHILSRHTHIDKIYDTDNLICLCRQCNNQLGTNNKLDFDWKMNETSYTL